MSAMQLFVPRLPDDDLDRARAQARRAGQPLATWRRHVLTWSPAPPAGDRVRLDATTPRLEFLDTCLQSGMARIMSP